MLGRVIYYNAAKGFGFIRVPSGEVVVLHHSDIPPGLSIDSGMKLDFDLRPTGFGRAATNIRVAEVGVEKCDGCLGTFRHDEVGTDWHICPLCGKRFCGTCNGIFHSVCPSCACELDSGADDDWESSVARKMDDNLRSVFG